MAIWNRKTPVTTEVDGIVGTVRFARRDSDVGALHDGDIALVELPDLDLRQAQQLIDRRVAAVLNATRSSSGRVPNTGPQMLARAGIVLVDLQDEGAWTRLKDGETVRVEHGSVFRDEVVVVRGEELDDARIAADLASAQDGLGARLDSLAANAADHIRREQAMLLTGASVPQVRTRLDGRPVVVVSRSHDAVADLRSLRGYIREHDPVLIGAGPGADLLLEAGHTPSIVIGALDHLSDRAIRAAGEVVVTTPSGTLDAPERLERHGMEIATFVSSGADDDLAIVLADSHEAAVIVHVGAPATLTELLERPPADAARMLVARLRAGARIVDAKAIRHFSTQRLGWWPALLLLIAGIAAVAVATAVTPVGQDWYDTLGDRLGDLGSWIEGLFS